MCVKESLMTQAGQILTLLMFLFRYFPVFSFQLTRSRLDRAVVARYYGFLVISQLFIFTLIGVAYREWLIPLSYGFASLRY